MASVEGSAAAVPATKRDAYLDQAAPALPPFNYHDGLRMKECGGDAMPDGKVADVEGAVSVKANEVAVCAAIEWRSEAVRGAGLPRVMEDMPMPSDGLHVILRGLHPILDA